MSQFYNEHAETYDSNYQRPIDLAENGAIFKAVHWSPGMRVLDLACGTGLVLDNIPIPPDDYLGIDLAHMMLEVARNKHPQHKYMLHDMQRLQEVPRLKGSFDLALCIFSLNYATDPTLVFEGMRWALAPGGRYFVLTYGKRYARRPSYLANQYHVDAGAQFFSARGLKRLAGTMASVRGFHALAESLNLPSAHYLSLESHTLGRLLPDACLCLIAEEAV